MQPEDFPIDAEYRFLPNRHLHISQKTGLSTKIIVTDADIETSNDEEPLLYNFKRQKLFATHFKVYSGSSSNTPIAILKASVFTLGSSKLHLLHQYHEDEEEDSPSSATAHVVSLKTVSLMRRALTFTVDSVPYFWVISQQGHDRTLWKVKQGKRIVVGRFTTRKRNTYSGALELAAEETDDLIASVSCAAFLNMSDSFTL